MKVFDCIARGIAVFVIGTVFSWSLTLSSVFIVEDASGVKASLNSNSASQPNGSLPYFVPAVILTFVFFLISICVIAGALDERQRK